MAVCRPALLDACCVGYGNRWWYPASVPRAPAYFRPYAVVDELAGSR